MSAQPARPRENSLLVPFSNEDDSASLRTLSDQDSDSEDDEVVHGAQTSLEIAKHDRSVLEEEEERERLLLEGGKPRGLRRMFSGNLRNGDKVKIGKRDRRRRRRQERRDERRARNTKLMMGQGEDEELMYEMEQGGLKSDRSSESSEGSSELDRRKYRDVMGKQSKNSSCLKFTILFSAIIVLFLIILLAAYQLSRGSRVIVTSAGLLSNGTTLFAPTTILISLDGFRADFLNRGLTPTLSRFITEGISPKYMLPSFPSVTFPNHFTLATGLYPEAHGIVGNTFWDPQLQAEFYYTDPARSLNPKWWNGEPIWVTAENQGVKTAIHMWPGSEAHIGGIEPTHLDKYNGKEPLPNKVDRILGLIDLKNGSEATLDQGGERPQFIAAYVPVIDAIGHRFGPNSTEMTATIIDVDNMLKDIFAGLKDRNLTDIVNIVIVSDHGMATTSTERLIQLDDLINVDLVEHTDGWPLYGLRPKNPEDLDGLYEHLLAESKQRPGFDVYLRDKTMPERYHFTQNDRIAPLWIVPKTGWAIVVKKDFDVQHAKDIGEIYHPRGLHGYDHENPLMRAIFVAKGPAFPHKQNSRVEIFQNTEVYNIICDTLSLNAAPNNGTIRLPLKPIGLHSDFPDEADDDPKDPIEFVPGETSTKSSVESTSTPSSKVGVEPPEQDPARPVVNDEGNKSVSESEKSRLKQWLGFLKGKIKGAKGWIKDLFKGAEQKGEEKENEKEEGQYS